MAHRLVCRGRMIGATACNRCRMLWRTFQRLYICLSFQSAGFRAAAAAANSIDNATNEYKEREMPFFLAVRLTTRSRPYRFDIGCYIEKDDETKMQQQKARRRRRRQIW